MVACAARRSRDSARRAIAFGRGCFMAIRNVLSHEDGDATELSEQVALEYLAAFSISARWIDSAHRID